MRTAMKALVASLLVAALAPALGLAADKGVTLPAGTSLHVRLTTTLTSKTNKTGDKFTRLIGLGSERCRQPDVECGAGRQSDAFVRCPRPSRRERRHQETRNQRLHCRSHKSL